LFKKNNINFDSLVKVLIKNKSLKSVILKEDIIYYNETFRNKIYEILNVNSINKIHLTFTADMPYSYSIITNRTQSNDPF